MLPDGGKALKRLEDTPKQPSRNYRMLIESSRIFGVCDGREAMEQVIYKILNTERYRYVVYSWNYGIELLWAVFGMLEWSCMPCSGKEDFRSTFAG